MNLEFLNLQQSSEAFERLSQANFIVDESKLSNEYQTIRKELLEIDKKCSELDTGKKYNYDVYFAYYEFKLFNSYKWFTKEVSCNYGFWRYISLMVCPEIINKRFPGSEPHFYKKNVRIYYFVLYWFLYLSLIDNDPEKTLGMLLNSNFNTDTYFEIIERPGRQGINVELYREIFKTFSSCKTKTVVNTKGENESILRVVLKINSAKLLTTSPNFYDGGIKGYVNMLFIKAGAIL